MSTRTFRTLIPALLLAAMHGGTLASQEVLPTAATSPDRRGEELTVYVMTMGAGSFVWERFGHNAIWIHDEARGTDYAYNWGLFSFEQENFILRFIQGRMEYWMGGYDAEQTATSYIRADRSVWLQELELTPAQRADLRDYLEWNSLPENRFYRYDYFRDNCSTRVRDALDRALGGQIRAQTTGLVTDASYRDFTRGATGESPVLFTGLMLALGQPTDRALSVWEEMFLPLRLQERIRSITVEGPDGARLPLVRAEREVYLSTTFAPGLASGPGVLPYLGIGLVMALLIALSARGSDRRRDSRAALRLLAIGWAAVAGVLGTIILGVWLLTDHAAAYRNENLFFFNPLLLGLGVLIPLAAGAGSRHRRSAYRLAILVAALSVLGVLLKLLPGFHQENGELIALALPVNLAFAFAAWELKRRSAARGPRSAADAPLDEPVPNPA